MEAHEAFERFEHAHHAAHEGEHGKSGDGGGHDEHDDHGGSGSLARLAAVSVSVMAIFLAIASFLGSEAVKDVISNQTGLAADEAMMNLVGSSQVNSQFSIDQLAVLTNSSDIPLAKASQKAYNQLQQINDSYTPEYNHEQKQISDDKADNKTTDSKHLFYGLAEVILQVAIVLASVAIVARRRWLLYGGYGVAAAGIAAIVVGLLR